MLSFIGNILWILCGGFLLALEWFLFGILWCCTIIGIPFGVACFRLGYFSLWPFGKTIQDGPADERIFGTFLFNVLWFVFGGVWLFISHLVVAGALFLTIIGIPFGIQHVKLGFAALAPLGKRVV